VSGVHEGYVEREQASERGDVIRDAPARQLEKQWAVIDGVAREQYFGSAVKNLLALPS
jgi:hypothetical protein